MYGLSMLYRKMVPNSAGALPLYRTNSNFRTPYDSNHFESQYAVFEIIGTCRYSMVLSKDKASNSNPNLATAAGAYNLSCICESIHVSSLQNGRGHSYLASLNNFWLGDAAKEGWGTNPQDYKMVRETTWNNLSTPTLGQSQNIVFHVDFARHRTLVERTLNKRGQTISWR